MLTDQKRYFIELYPESVALNRSEEDAARRQQATRFINSIDPWLKARELAEKVSRLTVTPMGQIQITCAEDVITELRSHQEDIIATIRPSASYLDTLERVGR